jgi:hypothetical protein
MWMVVLAVVVAAACGDKKDAKKEPPGPKEPAPREEDPQCAEKIAPFAEWMKALVADGHTSVITTGMELAEVDVGPTPITRGAPVVVVRLDSITISGQLAANPMTTKGGDLRAPVAERLTGPGPDVVLVIDRKVTWDTAASVIAAAADAKHSRITFAFAAGQAPAASKPPPSAIDSEIDAITKKDATAADLAAPIDPDGGVVGKVFADCAAVTQKLFPAIDKLTPAEFDVAVAVGMPQEIEACGCRVELASVQRLMWAWWGRDMGPALASVKLEISPPGKGITEITTAKDALWQEASQLFAAAAPLGKPVAVK